MRNFSFIAIFLFLSPAAFAWETDNITCRGKKISDSSEALNKETNKRMQEALSFANGEKSSRSSVFPVSGLGSVLKGKMLQEQPEKTCRRENLLAALRNQVANPWSGNLEVWADSAPISKCSISSADSVFSVLTPSESMVVKAAGINPVINVNGHYIGIDKLSHFMTEGADYKDAAEKTAAKGDGDPLKKALAIGIVEEEGSYGWIPTGVKSYGDMAANYKGYTFWTQVFDGDNPYFICENNKWKQIREFDWTEYVDDSMDESINCNEYRTADMNRRVDREVERRWADAGYSEKRCPASTESCTNLANKIQPKEVRNTILHPRCLEAAERTTRQRHTQPQIETSKTIKRGIQ